MAEQTRSPYQILGLSEGASQEEIKTAYRNLAKKFHPDLNPGNKKAEKTFKEINSAYESIGTPEARKKYEGEFQRGPYYYETQQGPSGGRYSGGSSGFEGLDPEVFASIFGSGFGSGFGSEAGPRAETYRIEVSLKDAIHGVQKEFVLPTGKKLSVKIPPGVTNGTKLRFPDQVYFEVQLKEPPGFRIEGDDLVSELSVFVPEALVGGDVRAETIDGPVLVHVPAGVDSDRRIRLAGRGLYNRSTNVRGAQIFIVKLRMPKFVPPELVAAAKKKAAAA